MKITNKGILTIKDCYLNDTNINGAITNISYSENYNKNTNGLYETSLNGTIQIINNSSKEIDLINLTHGKGTIAKNGKIKTP